MTTLRTLRTLLAGVPDLGPRRVGELLEFRPYVATQQFRREVGKYVGDETVAGYERYVFVPIEVDASDAATLEQIPGLDACVTAQLIDARPFGPDAACLEQLGRLDDDSRHGRTASSPRAPRASHVLVSRHDRRAEPYGR